MSEIIEVLGRQILDSRGNPTLEVDVTLRKWCYGQGGRTIRSIHWLRGEAVELRDKNAQGLSWGKEFPQGGKKCEYTKIASGNYWD